MSVPEPVITRFYSSESYYYVDQLEGNMGQSCPKAPRNAVGSFVGKSSEWVGIETTNTLAL